MPPAHADDPAPDPLADAAVAPITSGMIVGLGTGRAASRAVHALAKRARHERLRLTCVATSDRTARLAADLDLTVRPLRDVMEIDYLFDGADEVDPQLALLKGAGGAMTLEKIAAYAARKRVYLVQRRKLVERLGANHRLPVEVLEHALGVLTVRLEWLKLDPQLRLAGGDAGVSIADATPDTPVEPYRTDAGNAILDLTIPDDRPAADVELMLRLMPGVVGHGLFLEHAHEVLVEDDERSNTLARLVRTPDGTREERVD